MIYSTDSLLLAAWVVEEHHHGVDGICMIMCKSKRDALILAADLSFRSVPFLSVLHKFSEVQ